MPNDSTASVPRLQLGILAPEMPPMLGGMAELARHLVLELGQHHAIRLYTPEGHGVEAEGAEIERGGRIGRRPWGDLDALRAAERRHRSGRPPVHAWLALNAGLAPLAPCLDRPFFLYVHGNDFLAPWIAAGPRMIERIRWPVVPRVRQALRRRALAKALPSVRRVFANSRGTADRFADQTGHPTEAITVVPPGVPDAFFDGDPSPTPWTPRAGRPLRLLTVTRLSSHTRRKNVDGVLDAIAYLPATLQRRLRYTIVGGGDDRRRLEDHAAAIGVDPLVTFLGSVDEPTLRSAYRDADLFVMASRATAEDIEGFGIVYLEAAAAGTPSIASREGGAVEAIEPGRSGLVIDHSTPEAIAGALTRVLEGQQIFDPATVRAWAERHRWPAAADRLREQLLADL